MAARRPPMSAATRHALVVMNRQALDAAVLGIADGLYEIGLNIAADAVSNTPRDPVAAAKRGAPMMADTSGVGVWVSGLRVAGQGNAPGSLATPRGETVMAVGFGSPLFHFMELGTVKEIARPIMVPAFNRGIKGAAETVIPAMGKRIKAVP